MRSFALLSLVLLSAPYLVMANGTVDIPQWMQAQTSVPFQDAEAAAVNLLDQTVLSVQPNGSITRRHRVVCRILRPGGADWGNFVVFYGRDSEIKSMRAWVIPPGGQPYATSDKQLVDSSASDLIDITDRRKRTLAIPGLVPGSLVGFESTLERRTPVFDDDDWRFQQSIPRRSAQYTLELPPGWQYIASWRNHPEMTPHTAQPGQWVWDVADIPAVPVEPDMPAIDTLAASLHLWFFGRGARGKAFQTWGEVGSWYLGLSHGRDDASPEMIATVSRLTANSTDTLDRMRALASYVQNHIRYVAIELGIGGYQPHPAADVFRNGYGDCKDQVTLLRAMLKKAGLNAFYVLVHSRRGVIAESTIPALGFNHMILAIQLPADVSSSSLVSVQQDPSLGRILYFDPTNSLTPLGRLSGELQASYGLLVTATDAHQVRLPEQPADAAGIRREGKFSVDEDGNLTGDVIEIRRGDRADADREMLLVADGESGRLKPIETVLSDSFSNYNILKAAVGGAHDNSQPIEWHYSLEAEHYARSAGELLLLRPRVLGIKTLPGFATDKPRHEPVEIPFRFHDADDFSVTIPPGYTVAETPPAVDLNYDFGSYHSKATVSGNVIRYTRTWEIDTLQVSLANTDALQMFHRNILADERNVATLTRAKTGRAVPGT